MMNSYPELPFEQSWDSFNYSIQDGEGNRGTLSFYNNYCVIGIRDDHGRVIQYKQEILNQLLNDFPNEIIGLAQSETLQYLLENVDGNITPAISIACWCDDVGFYTNASYEISE